MAKKKTSKKKAAKKPVKKKSAKKTAKKKTTKQDIKDEESISKDINELIKAAHHDEELTKKEIEEVKRLDEDVAKELSKPKEEIKTVEKSSKSFNRKIILSALILIVIVVIGFLYAQNVVFPRENLEEYNGFEFRQNGKYWEVNLDYGWLPFFHHPTEVENIPVDPLAVQAITDLVKNKGKLWISVDPNDPAGANLAYAGVEISKVTTQFYGINTSSAFLYELEGYEKEIIRCRDAKGTSVVMRFVNGTTNMVEMDDYCIFMRGVTPSDYTLVADAVSYRILGIITN